MTLYVLIFHSVMISLLVCYSKICEKGFLRTKEIRKNLYCAVIQRTTKKNSHLTILFS